MTEAVAGKKRAGKQGKAGRGKRKGTPGGKAAKRRAATKRAVAEPAAAMRAAQQALLETGTEQVGGEAKPVSAGAKRSGRGAVKKLQAEARRQVAEKTVEIARSLLDSTLKGHVQSARLLMQLAESQAVKTEVPRKAERVSQAEKWGAEAEWPGVVDEAKAETSDGSREPEI